MNFLGDEHTPTNVVEFLGERGHSVRLARVDVGVGASDERVCEHAHQEHLTVITCNVRHYERFMVPFRGYAKYPNAGAIFFKGMKAHQILGRLDPLYTLIEAEMIRSSTFATRMIVYVTEIDIRFPR